MIEEAAVNETAAFNLVSFDHYGGNNNLTECLESTQKTLKSSEKTVSVSLPTMTTERKEKVFRPPSTSSK